MRVKSFEPIEVKTTDGWFVRLVPQSWSDEVQIWIGKSTPAGNFVCYFDEKGRLNEKKVEQGASDVKPTLELHQMIWDGLLRAFQGVAEPPEKSHIEGELVATKFHLDDLRVLLKLKSNL